MYNWCMEHPILTFLILITLADSIGYWLRGNKKGDT